MFENYIDSIIINNDFAFIIKTVIRLIAALVLSGFIGNEREHINRPAGIRTHVLVCIGAALTMITSEYVSVKYAGVMNMDPTRLGAQVVSGIGFLGAGTIIKEGMSVKGLTTAASLWAVSCVGLACGTGFYIGAIFSAVLVYFVLQNIKRFLINHANNKYITIITNNADHCAKEAAKIFTQLSFNIVSSEIAVDKNDMLEIKYMVSCAEDNGLIEYAIKKLRMTDDIVSVHIE